MSESYAPPSQIRVGALRSVDLRPLQQALGEVKVRLPYFPRTCFKPYHERVQRFAINVAHRRAGKTVAEVNDGGRKILTNKRVFPVPQAAFISPTFSQGKRNAWPYAKHYFRTIPGMRILEGDLTLVFPNGGRYIFAGSDNFDSLRGMYLDHASLDEYGSQDPRVWGEVVRPALSDYAGTATFIGSAKGRNHFYSLLQAHRDDPDWYISILKASETGILSKAELEAAAATMTSEQYQQEYECSFDAAVTGTFYGKDIELAEKEDRITSVPHDRAVDVYAAWDLGIGNSMAVWIFQIVGKEYHFINYINETGKDLPWFMDWVKELPYKVNLNILPHDAKARELQTGKTRQQFFETHNMPYVTLERDLIADGIHACRLVFNRCWFDRFKCAGGIDALRMYRTQFDAKHNVFSEKPLHDWSSDGSDAFRAAIMGARDKIQKIKTEDKREMVPESWMR